LILGFWNLYSNKESMWDRQNKSNIKGEVTGCEARRVGMRLRTTKILPRTAKSLVLRHGRRITSARIAARLSRYSLSETFVSCWFLPAPHALTFSHAGWLYYGLWKTIASCVYRANCSSG